MGQGTDSSLDETLRWDPSAESGDDTELDAASPTELGRLPTLDDTERREPQVTTETPGRYILGRQLGVGGQSRVSIAFDTHLGREIAFKQPRAPAGTGATEEALGRFLKEARITARLEHPNIVPVYEIGQRADGSYYCAQKLIRSADEKGQPRTLGQALAESRSLEDRLELLPHFLNVCHAIAYAHERGIIHRDIKPDNIVIGRLGETVVLDWGIAKVLSAEDETPAPGSGEPEPADGETAYGYAFGTPSYMGPEQAAGQLDRIDERADIWSLGAVLYELLTGRPPHTGGSPMEIVQRVIDEQVTPALAREPDAPPELAAVSEKALARSPEQRYASAAELAEEVAAFLAGLRVGVYRYSLWELVRLFVNRHRAASIVTAIAAVLLAASTAVAWRNYRQAEDYLDEARGYLADARENLARAFVEKARRADRELQWDRAAAYYAAARAQADLPEARWGAMLAENRKDLGLVRLQGHLGPVGDLSFSPDGSLLATAGTDRTVRLWDVQARRERSRFDIGTVPHAIDFAPDGATLAMAGADGSVRILDVEGGGETTVYRHPDEVNAVAFSPRGDHLAIGTADYHVLVYELASGEPRFDRVIPRNPVYTIGYAPDGSAVFVGGWDGAIRALDPVSGETLRTFAEAHNDAVLSLAFSRDGELLVTAGRDSLAKLWNLSDGTLIHRFEGHTQKVYAVAFSPNGRFVASGSTDKTVRLWSVESGELLVGESYGLEDEVSGVSVSPNGDRIAWVGGETVWLRHIEQRLEPPSGNRIETLEMSPDGSRLAAVTHREVMFYDSTDLAEMGRLARPTGRDETPRRSSSSGAGPFVTTMVEPRGNWRLTVGEYDERVPLRGYLGSPGVRSVALSPDGDLLAVGFESGQLEVWDSATWKVLRTLDAGRSGVRAVAFAPDGKTLASGNYDTTAVLWDTSTWTERARLLGHGHGVRRVAFSPDGSLLATASWDRTVRLWDVGSGEQRAVLEGHEDYVFGLAFDPRGQFLVSAGWDGTLRVWGLEDLRELAVFATDEARVFAVTMLPGGESLAYAGLGVHRIELGDLAPPEKELERVLRETGLVLRGIELERAAGASR